MDEQKRWLDSEVEKIVEQRKQMKDLQEDLKRREAILSKKESILTEKSELEMKKLRSSQVLDKVCVQFGIQNVCSWYLKY